MLRKILVVAAFVLGCSSVAAAEVKIGVVNVAVVESKMPQLQMIAEKIKAQFKEEEEKFNALGNEYKDLYEKTKKDEMTLTLNQKINNTRRLQELEQEAKLKKKFLDEDYAFAQKQELQKLREKIRQAIDNVAKEGKFDLILHAESAAYASSAVDITDKVVAIVSNPAG